MLSTEGARTWSLSIKHFSVSLWFNCLSLETSQLPSKCQRSAPRPAFPVLGGWATKITHTFKMSVISNKPAAKLAHSLHA